MTSLLFLLLSLLTIQSSAGFTSNNPHTRVTLLWGASVGQQQDPTSESPAVPEAMAAPSRGKVNEIDFCIAPADVSLSRSYSKKAAAAAAASVLQQQEDPSSPVLSLTRALNNASNRAVRRILLARAWPSAEALNKSFRQAALAEKEREAMANAKSSSSTSGAKCPIPRPILNLLVRRKSDEKQKIEETSAKPSSPRSRTDEEYVTDQLNAFRGRYGDLPGYKFAEAYLESILSLATSGKESPRVKEVRVVHSCRQLLLLFATNCFVLTTAITFCF